MFCFFTHAMFTHDHVRSCLFGLFICFMIGLFWRPDIGKHGGLSWRKRLGNHLEIRTTAPAVGRLFRRPNDCSSGRTIIPAAGRLFQRPDDCLGGRTITPAYHSGGRILPRIVTPVPLILHYALTVWITCFLFENLFS